MNKLIVFDLDGTLIDSAGGIARSVNRTREKFGFPPLDKALITSYTGNGAKKLLERSTRDVRLPIPLDDAVAMMTAFYAADPLFETFPYPGVLETLHALHKAGYLLAVLSNKPQAVSEKIVAGLEISALLCANIGGGAGFPLKPEPDALLYLLKKFDADIENSFVVGDNYTDLAAAENANMRSIFCSYGIGTSLQYVPDAQINKFSELPAALAALSN